MIKFSEIGPFNYGLAPIKQKGKWGFINKSGVCQIPCQYDLICLPSDEGKIAVRKNKKWGYINADNIAIIDFVFDDASSFSDRLAPVKQGKMWGVINEYGKMVIQPIYNQISQSPNHIFSAKKDEKWGVIDGMENIILPFIYDSLTEFSYGISYVRIGQKHGFINLKGEFVLELTKQQKIYPKPYFANFESTVNFEFIPVVNIKGRNKYDWSIYSNKGELIADSLRYTFINTFREGLADVYSYGKKPKWGMINSQGELIIPCEYDKISPFLCNLAFVSKGIYCGYIDKNNHVKIPLKYKAASVFCDNLAYVSTNGWHGQFIDTEGNTVLNLKKEKNFNNILNFLDLSVHLFQLPFP